LATCADFGHGFVDAARNTEIVPRTLEQTDLAVDFGAHIISTYIGVVPETPNVVWDILRIALNTIGAYAEKKGVVLATETRPESGSELLALLDVKFHDIIYSWQVWKQSMR